jgi:hypothetical protein
VLTPRRLRILTTGSLDLVRRKLTSGVEIAAAEGPVRRGDQVEALVTISNAAKVGSVEVGLVCTEYYDEEVESPSTSTTSEGFTQTSSSRETLRATAHEDWRPVDSVVGVQTVGFQIPVEAPFSFEGDCLSFRWAVVARGRRPGRLDAVAEAAISVTP